MALQAITKYTHVEGVSIYAVTNGQSASAPSAVDVSVNLPELVFESVDIPMMGTATIYDQTRLGNLELSVTLEADNPQAQALVHKGLCEWKLCWVESKVEPSGLTSVVGFNVYVKGYVSSIPEGSKEVGAQATADYKMSLIADRKTDSTGRVYYDVDRSQGKLIVNGVDYRADVNALL